MAIPIRLIVCQLDITLLPSCHLQIEDTLPVYLPYLTPTTVYYLLLSTRRRCREPVLLPTNFSTISLGSVEVTELIVNHSYIVNLVKSARNRSSDAASRPPHGPFSGTWQHETSGSTSRHGQPLRPHGPRPRAETTFTIPTINDAAISSQSPTPLPGLRNPQYEQTFPSPSYHCFVVSARERLLQQ